MTLSITAENTTPKPENIAVVAHHVEYEKPESGCRLQVGLACVRLTAEDALKLGTFLVGGHAAVEALEV